MYTGSCLCKAVTLEVHDGITDIIHCHCSKCRKASGTAYATNGFISSAGLRITQGQENIRAYEGAPGLVPYLAWVSFAAVLNFTLWQLNPALLG